MAVFAAFVSVVGSLFLTPFLMFLLCIIFLASIGKSLGVRRLYVKVLLMIFEVSSSCHRFRLLKCLCLIRIVIPKKSRNDVLLPRRLLHSSASESVFNKIVCL